MKETLRRKHIEETYAKRELLQEVLMEVNAEKLEKAGFTENELKRAEKALAEKHYAFTQEFVTETLSNGDAIELQHVMLLSPFQSGFKLRNDVDAGENTSRHKNKVRVVLRKRFEDDYNKINFDHLK